MDKEKYCRYCRTANPIRASFCSNCGKTFTRASTSTPPAPPPPTSTPPAPPPPTSQELLGYQPLYDPPPKPRRRFKKRYVLYGVVVLLALFVVAAAFSGSTQSGSTQGATDYSSYFNTLFSGGTMMIKEPFTKGTSESGNDIYKGVTKNSSAVGNYAYTTTVELTQSQADAKTVYDTTVAQKLNGGFTAMPNEAASYKANAQVPYVEVWVGQSATTGDLVYVMYWQDTNVQPSWLCETSAGGSS